MNYEISMFFPVLKRGFVPIEFVPQSEINCLFFNVMLATYLISLVIKNHYVVTLLYSITWLLRVYLHNE